MTWTRVTTVPFVVFLLSRYDKMNISNTVKATLNKIYGSPEKAQKHLRKTWLAALESGKFKQDTGQLRRPKVDGKSYGYCCLGVLSKVAAQQGVGSFTKETYELDGLTERECLLPSLRTVVGLTANQCDTLMNMNDDEDRTFDEIATHLRALWSN